MSQPTLIRETLTTEYTEKKECTEFWILSARIFGPS